ncbi:MFS transporter [Curtobacterium flaccumfaciens]|nr:MFS transporter [Curtobacterium flaccumfaciens]
MSTPFWGWLSDRVGRRVLTIWSAVGIAVLIWPFFAFLDAGPLALLPLVALVGMCVFHDSIYGPQAAWFAEQFPTGRRYSGMSLGYQIGSIFSVGLTPLLAAVFVELGGARRGSCARTSASTRCSRSWRRCSRWTRGRRHGGRSVRAWCPSLGRRGPRLGRRGPRLGRRGPSLAVSDRSRAHPPETCR